MFRKSTLSLFTASCLLACTPTAVQKPPVVSFPIGPQMPEDVEGGAGQASLQQAGHFSWQQFIALNWPAAQQSGAMNTRGMAWPQGDPRAVQPSALRVWQTLRAKTEVFPGIGQPHGFEAGSAADFGFDQPPEYRYDPASVGQYPGLEPGQVPACFADQADNEVPWIELSEAHEVGPEKLYAGAAPVAAGENTAVAQRVLFSVKVDRGFYRYVVARGWLDGGNAGSIIPATATQKYLETYLQSPPADSDTLVSFPDQTLQVKTSWRRLSDNEKASGRYLTAWARSYRPQDPTLSYLGQAGNEQFPCFVDSEWGLIGMHIKTRTRSAPYYIWATFEHADNITDQEGIPVEDQNGRQLRNHDVPPTDPEITSRNAVATIPATPGTIQKMSPVKASAEPGKRMYYRNTTGTPTTQGRIAINRRSHPIPEPVIEANEQAHQAIGRYLQVHGQNKGVEPLLQNYMLVGVQWKPANKPIPGQDVVADADAGNEVLRYPLIYYLANMTMETSYRLQHYSGVVQFHLSPPYSSMDVQDLISDFDSTGQAVSNVTFGPEGAERGKNYNMGGCMGCHGQIQQKGYDFNFIFRRGRINAPETEHFIRTPLQEMVHGKRLATVNGHE